MASGRDDRRLMRDFVVEIYDHFHAHKDAVLALISASGEPEAQDAVRLAVNQIQAMFDHLAALSAELWQKGGGFDLTRAPVIHRLVHGMLISITVLEPLFMPDGHPRPTREQIIDTATDILLSGIVDKA
jgi:AcrR family transcriptional regulator